MQPTKSLGPDGMPAIFYQKYWDIVSNDVVSMVLNVLNSNISMADINKTFITLIPKTNNPTKMTNFRPISLSNVIYKLISKVFANRLKLLLFSLCVANFFYTFNSFLFFIVNIYNFNSFMLLWTRKQYSIALRINQIVPMQSNLEDITMHFLMRHFGSVFYSRLKLR